MNPGALPCNLCQKDTYAPAVALTSCLSCGRGYLSPQGSDAASACQVPQQPNSDHLVEFQVTLSYSSAAFTLQLQDKFTRAITTVAKTGCKCEIRNEDVSITRISDSSRRVHVRSRRLQGTAESIYVDVSIRVQNIDTGNLLVENRYLTKDAMNKELAMEGVNPITEVTISPVLKTYDTSSVSTEPALSKTAIAEIVVALMITAILFMCITYYNVKNRKNVNVDLMPVEEVRQQEGEENHCMYITDSLRLMREEEEARKKREEEDTL